jgi:hypothetical protein
MVVNIVCYASWRIYVCECCIFISTFLAPDLQFCKYYLYEFGHE